MRTLLLLTTLLASPAMGQKAKPPLKAAVESPKEVKLNWDGEWTLQPSQSDKIDEQIEAHVKDLNFALRLFWKKKLQSACLGFNKLDILAGDGFSVTMGKERSIDTPTDGTEVDWKRSDDAAFKATLTRNGPTMIQTLRGDGYTLTYVYSMRKDGESLAIQGTYSHPKLDNPFTFKLVFRRND